MFDAASSAHPEAAAVAPRAALDASMVAGWTALLAEADLALDDGQRVDLLRALEELKCAAEGAQASVTADFDDSQRDRAAQRGVPAERRGRGVAEQVALARRESPHRGRRHVRLARALREQMTCTAAALRAGRITEYKASLLMVETACLSAEDRMIVDAALAADVEKITAMGDREAAGEARKLAAQLDAESVAERRRRAEAERHVSVRPAPDTMTWMSALLPVKDGVAVYAALKLVADAARAAGDPRSRGQVMADTLVQKVTGRAGADAVRDTEGFEARGEVGRAGGEGSVSRPRASTTGDPGPEINLGLVMTHRTLWGGPDEAGWLEGYGPVPADLARGLVRHALEEGDKVWLRRLYTHPATGQLTAVDSRQRLFRANLAKLIRLRDRTCRTPWCDAPIRHIDHAHEHRAGGPADHRNGQGLCEACNHAKQAPGWHAQPIPDAPGHEIETTTPTGHRYRSRAPALTRPGYRQTRPGLWTRVA